MKKIYTTILLLFVVINLHSQSVITENHLEKKLELLNDNLSEDRVYLHVDKTIYKPGDDIWYTAFVRNASDLKQSDQSEILHIALINAKNEEVINEKILCNRGVTSGCISTYYGLSGGFYTIRAWTNWQKNDSCTLIFEKEILINNPVLPRLLMKLDFTKKGYGPGENVQAELILKNLENNPLSNLEFSFVVFIQGKKIITHSQKSNAEGKSKINFKLPDSLKSIDGLLNVIIKYKGETESISRSIPIQLNNIQFELYPEGGDLINGFPSRVGFQALNYHGKPTQVEGILFNEKGKEITTLQSFHEGMGYFEFTPDIDNQYFIKVTKPSGNRQIFHLPEIKHEGVSLRIENENANQIKMTLHSSNKEKFTLLAQTRGTVYYSRTKELQKGMNSWTIQTSGFPMGVCQITLLNQEGLPLAERLTFINKDRSHNISIETNKKEYEPREKVKMKIKLTDHQGNPTSGQISLAVVDDKILTLADDKSGNILSKLLLEADITGEVDEPNFYFDKDEPKANQALDILLMTKGWRRFILTKKDSLNSKFEKEQKVIRLFFYDSIVEQPMRNFQFTVKETKKTYRTNDFGYCTIKNLDLNYSKTINFESTSKAYNYPWNVDRDKTARFYVNEYRSDYSIDISKRSFIEHQILGLFDSSARPICVVKDFGSLKGYINDRVTKKPISGVNVMLIKKNRIINGTSSGEDGSYEFYDISPGSYILVTSFIGYESIQTKIFIRSKDQKILNFNLKPNSTVLGDLISRDGVDQKMNPVPGSSITSEEIAGSPADIVNVLASTVGGVNIVDNIEYVDIRGQRSAGKVTYIDGIKVSGSTSLPESAIDQISVVLGGIPAQYGDKSEMTRSYIDYDLENTKPSYYRGYVDYNYMRNSSYTVQKKFPIIKYKRTKTNRRHDYRTTIYFDQIDIDTDGEKEIEFYNCDAISSFRTTVEGITSGGVPVRQEYTHHTKLKFSIEVKSPKYILLSDHVSMPVILTNNMNKKVKGKFEVSYPNSFVPIYDFPESIEIAPMSNKIIHLDFKVGKRNYYNYLKVGFKSRRYRIKEFDSKYIQTISQGFPRNTFINGTKIENRHSISISSMIAGSLKSNFIIYPDNLETISKGIESMVRKPYGCFEQITSATIPNMMMLDHMIATNKDRYHLRRRATNNIEKGYKKLLKFESADGGFSLFGKSKGDPVLSAYGVMAFMEMKKYIDNVDQKMIDRTIKWLMNQRDNQGGFYKHVKRNYEEMYINNAYIIWALSSSGVFDLKKELLNSSNIALTLEDPYLIALNALSSINLGMDDNLNCLTQKLMAMQQKDGSWKGRSHSVTHSRGNNLTKETTALAMLVLMKSKQNGSQLIDAANYLLRNRNGYGGFGSTQTTLLVLKALSQYFKTYNETLEEDTFYIYVNDQLADSLEYKLNTVKTELNDFIKDGDSGEYKIRVESKSKKNNIPFTIQCNWLTTTPGVKSLSQLDISTTIAQDSVSVGETNRLSIKVTNLSNTELASPMAIVGIPAGMSLQPWQLKEMNSKGDAFDYFETKDDKIILYFKKIAPGEIKEINLDLKADIPGTFTSAASCAYEYYADQHKMWVDGVQVVVRK